MSGREMKNLGKIAGIEIWLKPDCELVFGDEVQGPDPEVRELDDVREVLRKPDSPGPQCLYLMYRGISRYADAAKFRSAGIRYDITVLNHGTIGGEFVKTVGHYHPPVRPGGPTFPELYQVLHGSAFYVLQKPLDGAFSAAEFIVVEAREGEAVLVPPGYGHVTVNPGAVPLAMANLVSSTFRSDYEQMRRRRGAAFYAVRERELVKFVKNENYSSVSGPRFVRPVDIPSVGVSRDVPIYESFVSRPERFSYLTDPTPFLETLDWVRGG